MNDPLLNSERYPLQDVIIEDIFSANKTAFVLLFLIVLTAVGTVWFTSQTRELIAEKGRLISEKQVLEDAYVNLKLEETTLSDNVRIESIAKKDLGMKPVEPEQEVVILE
ncbi:cell division protein FtsL [Pasteurellaceae bacterium Pebbles2]|nr:cell division protein FtsL [Pasteurellaceae bacterium Pebbles2]